MNKKSADILIVDDNADNLELLKIILEAEGYNTRSASDGDTALMLASGRPPDLVFMDVNMPGMDGFEVCRLLKKLPSCMDVPILFLSAQLRPWDIDACFEAGGVDYIRDPFDKKEILLKADACLSPSM